MERFGSYLLVRPLASGRVTAVFKAKPIGTRGFTRTVQLHQVRPPFSGDAEFMEALKDQAHLAEFLDHPGVLRLLGQGEVDGTPFLVSDYLPGKDLDAVLARCREAWRKLPDDVTARIILAVLEALGSAHAFEGFSDEPATIPHGGLTPEQVILGYSGAVSVGGFAVAAVLADGPATGSGSRAYGLAYTSPEVARGEPASPSSDLFSVGLILGELLCLQPLYPAQPAETLEGRVQDGAWDRALLESSTSPLKGIVERLLATDPAERFESAGQAALALREAGGVPAGEDSQPRLRATANALFADDRAAENQEEVELAARIKDLVEQRPVGASEAEDEPVVDVLPLAAVLPIADPAPPPGKGETAPHEPPAVPAAEQLCVDVEVPEFVSDDTGEVCQVLDDGSLAEPAVRPEAADKPDYDGDLGTHSLAALLHTLATEQRTGRLELEREPYVKTLFLNEGRLEFGRSNIESEMLGEFLVAAGVITRETQEQVLAESDRQGMTFSEALLVTGAIPPHELAGCMEQQTRMRAVTVFEWTKGRFAFYGQAWVEKGKVPLRIDLHEVIAEGVREQVPLVVVRHSIGADRTRLPLRTKAEVPEGLAPGGKSLRVLRTINGKRSLMDIIDIVRDEEAVLRTAYLLRETGLIEFREPRKNDRRA